MSLITVCNALLEPIQNLNYVLTASRSEEINGENVLSFSVPLKSTDTALINNTNVIKLGDDYFDIASYLKQQNGGRMPTVQVDCEHVSYRLNDTDYDKDFFTEIGTPTYILGKILEGTDFTAGTVDFITELTYSAQEKKSRRQLLMELAYILGGELLFDGFEISLLEHRGSAIPKDLTEQNTKVLAKKVDKRKLDELGNPTEYYSCTLVKPIGLELGDAVTLYHETLEIDISLRIVRLTINPYSDWEVEFEVSNKLPSLEDDIYRVETTTISKEKLYNGIRIGPDTGFEAVRNDNKARAYFNSTNLAMQAGDGVGNWTNKLYYDFDPETGEATLVFDGKLSTEMIKALEAEFDVTVTNTIITNALAAEKATIAELTVDQLETSNKVQRYLEGSIADLNYIKIKGENIEFITAATEGNSEVQARSRMEEPLYWKTAERQSVTTDTTAWPVYIFEYTENIKMTLKHEMGENGVYTPKIYLGIGDGVTELSAKGEIYKGPTGLVLNYFQSGTGALRQIRLGDNGIEMTPPLLIFPDAKNSAEVIGSAETTMQGIAVTFFQDTTRVSFDVQIDITASQAMTVLAKMRVDGTEQRRTVKYFSGAYKDQLVFNGMLDPVQPGTRTVDITLTPSAGSITVAPLEYRLMLTIRNGSAAEAAPYPAVSVEDSLAVAKITDFRAAAVTQTPIAVSAEDDLALIGISDGGVEITLT